MAVAVEIGPRNTRRVTTAGVALGAIGALAVGLLLTHPFGEGSSHPSHAARSPVFVTDRLVYGMSKRQVLQRVGAPTTTAGACWVYRENLKIRQGTSTLDAERVCFLGGNYAYRVAEVDGKWESQFSQPKVPGF